MANRGSKVTATPPSESETASADPASDRVPRTERGRRTQRALLDAAAAEFGERGYHEASVVSITVRAGVALGTFYTYFASKDALFRDLVLDMSGRVRDHVAPALRTGSDAIDVERAGLLAFLQFAREHKEIYRIIDEAEFVAPDAWRQHYETTALRIVERMRAAAARGETSTDIDEVHGWALMGMNVFLGLRFGVMDDDRSLEDVVRIANALIRNGLGGAGPADRP